MAVIKKTLFAENLDRYQTFVTDTNPTSDYFKITELSDTFTGGKNAFLIQGSDYLVPDTLIKIEIKDSKGNIIYHEPGEGIVSSSVNGTEVVTEYYEGVSKVVAVHIYPDTAFGPATITILGELSTYNSNGLNSPIPLEWEGKYNVKWQRQINVNPSLANTTKIRFYRRPTATIVETLSPIYTIVNGLKVESNIVSSFANITLSKLDTFAGDVKRIKVYRTSEGDISDYDMIQDILLESKELLTSFNLTGSVISEAGLMTSEVLEKLWSYPTLTTQLTSSRIDNGVKLNGNGYFRYTSSLNLSENSVYEFGIDAFYSASTPSDMGIYVSGSNNGEILIGTLNGITPTKNLKDSLFQFTLPLAEPTASLYLSQSQSEWHIGNLSLKLTEDTAFSPSEISFVTSMPTVVGNESYNFKFEFYDVNNNYVPVLVTESALFTGGNNNIGGTLIFISSSASSSLAQLNAVSTSISGTATLYSSSANTTIVTLSGSVSGSIVTLSGSVSSSLTSLSSSVSASNALVLSSSFAQVKNLANGQFSGSFIGDNVIYSPTIGGQQGYIKELFTVGQDTSATINLDARTSTRKIWIGSGANGIYNDSTTGVYLDSTGKFSLKDKLTFDGSTLSVNGTINVTGGNAATQAFATTIGANAATSASLSASAAQQTAINVSAIAASNAALSASNAFTNAKAVADSIANGSYSGGTLISANSIVSPIIAGANGYISNVFKVGSGGITLDGANKTIYIGSGAYANTNTGFYVDSNGNFSLKDKLTWNGTTLTVAGTVNANAGVFSGNITSTATISGGTISGGTITGGSINIGTGFSVNNQGVLTATGANISGNLTATGGTFGGWTIDGNRLRSNSNAIVLDGGNNSITMTVDGLTRFNLNTSDSLPEPNVIGGGTLSIPAVTTSYEGVGSFQRNSNDFVASNSVLTNFELRFTNNSYVAEYGGVSTSTVNVYYTIRNVSTGVAVASSLLTSAAARGGNNFYDDEFGSGGGEFQTQTPLANTDVKLEARLVAGQTYRAELLFEYSTNLNPDFNPGTTSFEESYFRANFGNLTVNVAVQVATVVINGGGFLSAVNAGKYLRMSNLTPSAVNIEGGISWDSVNGRPGFVARAWVVATWSERTSNFSSATIRAGQNVLAVGRSGLGINTISFTQSLPTGTVTFGNSTLGAVFASGLRKYTGAGSSFVEYQTDIACSPNFGGGSSVQVFTYDNDRNASENVNLLNVVVFA